MRLEISVLFIVGLLCQIVAGFRVGKCKRPKLPANAVLTATSQLQLFRGRGFALSSQIKFQCKVGYVADGLMWSLCGDNGQWIPEPRSSARCVYDKRRSQNCGKGQFKCQSNGECIDIQYRCDCTLHCRDGSDEENCSNAKKIIVGTPKIKSSGVITSPGYPTSYPRKFKCTYSFITEHDFRFRLAFLEVGLRPAKNGKCQDFLKMSGGYRQGLSSLDEAHRTHKSDLPLICGAVNPLAVISNSSTIDLIVSLDGGRKKGKSEHKLRGFALTWSLLASDEVPNNSQESTQQRTQGRRVNFVEENYVTVVLPIVISALVPVVLILYMCRKKKTGVNEVQKEPNDVVSSKFSDCQQHKVPFLSGDDSMAIFCDLKAVEHANSTCQSRLYFEQQPMVFSGSNICDEVQTPPIFQQLTDKSKFSQVGSSRSHGQENLNKQNTNQMSNCRRTKLHHDNRHISSRNFDPKERRHKSRHCDSKSINRTLAQPGEKRVEAVGCELSPCKYAFPYSGGAYQDYGLGRVESDRRNDSKLTEIDSMYIHPCRVSCGYNRKIEIPFHGSLNSDGFIDRRPLVAKQPISCHQTTSETETETTKSSLV